MILALLKILRQITISILYTICMRLVTFLSFIFATLESSNILVLTICLELINFIFQTSCTNVPETYTSLSSFVKLISINLVQIL